MRTRFSAFTLLLSISFPEPLHVPIYMQLVFYHSWSILSVCAHVSDLQIPETISPNPKLVRKKKDLVTSKLNLGSTACEICSTRPFSLIHSSLSIERIKFRVSDIGKKKKKKFRALRPRFTFIMLFAPKTRILRTI